MKFLFAAVIAFFVIFATLTGAPQLQAGPCNPQQQQC